MKLKFSIGDIVEYKSILNNEISVYMVICKTNRKFIKNRGSRKLVCYKLFRSDGITEYWRLPSCKSLTISEMTDVEFTLRYF